MKRLRHADLLAAVALVSAGAVAVEYAPFAAVRVVFVLPMLLLLPGYAVTAAAFGPQMPEPVHRHALSLGLSLSVSIVGALALNLTRYGLRDRSWTLFIVAVVWVGCTIAAVRRRSVAPPPSRRYGRFGVRGRDALVVLLATVIMVGALLFAARPLPAKNIQGYTSLSMVRSTPKGTRVAVEVASDELESDTYRLELRIGRRLVYVAPRIALAPGGRWRHTVAIAASPVRRPTEIVASLFKARRGPSSYREARLWLRPPASG